MRVIAGKARSLKLQTLEGMNTRPTTDRIKETLFNMIQPNLADARFLDLFAGSGAIGIEALSRGADCCVFVEQNKKAVSCIKANLEHTGLSDGAQIMGTDAVSALRRLDGEKPFDIIFMDPPYNKGLELEVLQALRGSTLVDEYTMLIVEASLETPESSFRDTGFEITKVKSYKTNQHIFLKQEENV